MKINNITHRTDIATVNDCYAGDGYVKRHHGSLPDIDSDFSAVRRDEVKAYLERRYNKHGLQRVFSAGTFTTEKIRSVIKDVARTHKIPQSTTNYLTTILDDDLTWTGLMRVASTDKRMRDFIQKYPDVFEEMLPIMGQTRSAGIHASALIITPEYVKGEQVECFDLLPIRKMGDLLVSEISGADIDAIGILKNDVLGIKELTRLSDTLQLIKNEYNVSYNILEIASKYLDDPKVFNIIKEGNTQGLFQIAGDGMTKFIKRMEPDNINDLIASVALFRPATLASGSTDRYVECKKGLVEPTYLWGTYNAMKDTFGILCIAAGSKVTTSCGDKCIEDVQVGDKVLTEDGTYQKVLANIDKGFGETVAIRTNFSEDLVCTPDHQILTSNGWKCAKYLTAKDLIKAFRLKDENTKVPHEEWAEIISINPVGMRHVYDLSVEKNHSFCVGGLVVHNCFQEQLAIIAREVGGFSLGDGVKLVKLISKKKVDKIKAQKDKFMSGAKRNGCPIDAAEEIWNMFEVAGTYLFNKSHATAYGLTAYVGAWLKTYYPTAFYTVILRDQDEDKMAVLMNEIRAVGGTGLVQPDINISDVNFTADFKNNQIYWSLTRIKYVGPKAVQYIVNERNMYGEFYDMEDFIKRIFRSRLQTKVKTKFTGFDDDGTPESNARCPVTAKCIKHLIYAGAFDKCEHVGSLTERYGIMIKAAELLNFEVKEKDAPEGLRDKHYFWSQQQINVSGMGSIDYRRIYDNFEKPNALARYPYIEFKGLSNMFCDVKKGVICCTICDVHDKTYKDRQTGETKHFGKIDLQQNTDTNVLTIWDDWSILRPMLKNAAGKILIAVAMVRWSDYDEKNTLQIGKSSFFQLV